MLYVFSLAAVHVVVDKIIGLPPLLWDEPKNLVRAEGEFRGHAFH